MRFKAIVLSALLLAGCASGPGGADLVAQVRDAEQQCRQGAAPWTPYYVMGFDVLGRLTPQDRVAALRSHYLDMLQYSRALDSGKLTAAEFTLVRERLEGEYLKETASLPPIVAALPGDSGRGSSVGEWIGAGLAVGLGAAALYNTTAPRNANPVVCNTGRPIGNTVQTICR